MDPSRLHADWDELPSVASQCCMFLKSVSLQGDIGVDEGSMYAAFYIFILDTGEAWAVQRQVNLPNLGDVILVLTWSILWNFWAVYGVRAST